ncbi:hypothetical protein LTR84_012603 [Exophiala bonariae]|uniref:tRNA (guanine(26)-N(2))-dimethyltransferase n=1 Tax=Exophiala bonariae TaxID=1690606 RepID=A0AAV9NI75_9EURO|nr:hypothetical protein LTR84_012603 [Exophiala bonariae]
MAVDIVAINGKKYRSVREGLASVLAPYGAESEPVQILSKQVKNNDEGNQAVFYNPIQQFNRDLTVLAITIYGEGAILQKSARSNQKPHRSKRKKQHAATSGVAQNNQEPISVQENHRKRKVDDAEDETITEHATDGSKRPKVDQVPDAEDDLPVAQLNGGEDSVLPKADASDGQNIEVPLPGVQALRQTSQPLTAPSRPTPFTILDALSATGLRALRYAKEIPFATNIVANDLSPEAVKSIELNIDHNEVKGRVHSNLADARAFMYSKVGNESIRQQEGYVHRFDVVDLDPYGTAAPFFDASLQALQDGGMLCVTCTDAGVFASAGYPEKTYALYGGIPTRGPHSHETGLRLILNGIAVSAARYGIAIEPLLSLSIDYYARLFVRIHKKPQEVKLLPGTTMIVYSCGHGCGSWTTQPYLRNQKQTAKNGDTFYKYSSAQGPSAAPNCDHCGSKTHITGPMWAGPLHNSHFVKRMVERIPSLDKSVYGTTDRLQGMLSMALEEDFTPQPEHVNGNESHVTTQNSIGSPDARIIPRISPALVDPAPFFIMPTLLAKVIHCMTPPEDLFRGALRGLGYRVTRSHCKPGSMKTNAPFDVIWEVVREYMRTKAPIKEGAVKKGTPGWNILARLRGTERLLVSELKDSSKAQIERCESKEDLKTVLQGMLYRLENEKEEDSTAPKETPNQADAMSGDQAIVENSNSISNGSKETPDDITPSKLKIIFDQALGKDAGRGKLVRYQVNPRENWGPMSRAGRTT